MGQLFIAKNDRPCHDLWPVNGHGFHRKSFGITRGNYLSKFSLHEIFSAGQLGAFRFPLHNIDYKQSHDSDWNGEVSFWYNVVSWISLHHPSATSHYCASFVRCVLRAIRRHRQKSSQLQWPRHSKKCYCKHNAALVGTSCYLSRAFYRMGRLRLQPRNIRMQAEMGPPNNPSVFSCFLSGATYNNLHSKLQCTGHCPSASTWCRPNLTPNSRHRGQHPRSPRQKATSQKQGDCCPVPTTPTGRAGTGQEHQ